MSVSAAQNPTGAQAVAQALRARGVRVVFGLCGDHTNPLFEACAGEGIRIVDARDERGAAWMAAGYALASGEPGVVMVSNTPALTNAATALADSNASGIPVLCITGGVSMRDRGLGHPGDADQAAIARPWSRRAVRVEDPARAAAETELALFGAAASRDGLKGRPGVAVLELPMDVQDARAEQEQNLWTLAKRLPDPGAITRARALLAGAQRPVILAGSGVFWSKGGDALQGFAETARIPVFTTRAARGLVSDDHEYCFGFPNLLSPVAQTVFAEADVALVAGCDLDLMVAGGNVNEDCRMIRIDADEDAFAIGRAADVRIVHDPREALEAIKEGAQPLATDDWLKRLRELADERAATIADRVRIGSTPLHPGRLVAEIAQKLPANAMVTVDAGELALWALDGIPARAPSAFHTSSASALGALGMGLPWAIGMKVACPDRPVLCIAGDGSFGFTAMELETSARHEAPVAVVVGNDGGWGIVRHLQKALHGRALASDLPRSPYELLAEFAGGVGDRVATPTQLAIAVTNALASKTPSVVNAILDPNVQHEALPLIAAIFAAKRDGA